MSLDLSPNEKSHMVLSYNVRCYYSTIRTSKNIIYISDSNNIAPNTIVLHSIYSTGAWILAECYDSRILYTKEFGYGPCRYHIPNRKHQEYVKHIMQERIEQCSSLYPV